MKNPLEHLIEFSVVDPSLKQRPLEEGLKETVQRTQALMKQLATKIQAEGLARVEKMYPKHGKMLVILKDENARARVDQLRQEVVGNEQNIFKPLPSTEEKPMGKDEEDQSKIVESGVAA